MGAHQRLGAMSKLRMIDNELLRMIIDYVVESTGVQRWKYLHGQDKLALTDFTTFRHVVHGTLVQISHDNGEYYEDDFRAKGSICQLDQGKGDRVPADGIMAGKWQVSYHGPNICISNVKHSGQTLMLHGDGFLYVPETSPVISMLGLPEPLALKEIFVAYVFIK
ncbi:hypothetical protein GUITHDRAFT_114716 [Guillardia theta CCMP2712]|uniref:Uncharacterized protein n=1 Tax=Guillardia theta (strain CCMP2712) TaxID=905079 RepID=L1ITZ0_GUITC|nr:hypothetical protein GUITHDRAFT_114716 [Guillardia theta CCMP2712]EKX39280.1 hypothetical protein GUITHDRAFT_114716 [Guillardia theta CCMP2712]|eukprot:XP_005826260.1 hypothetical protein GUITHDRAFT_114716 [Guillardia theta CCMP2712]